MLVVEDKELKGLWWKYGLLLTFLHLFFWLLSGYKFNPNLDLPKYLATGRQEVLIFIAAGFLPFVLARIGFHRLMWFGIVGFVVASISYFLLLFYEPLRQLPNFIYLPPIVFMQFDSSFILVGVVIEFGRYVFRKVME